MHFPTHPQPSVALDLPQAHCHYWSGNNRAQHMYAQTKPTIVGSVPHAKKIASARDLMQHPIVDMAMGEVETRHLSAYVLMPDEINTSFMSWWSIDSTTVVKVRFPHQRHGLAGKTSTKLMCVCEVFGLCRCQHPA